ncbi:MAG: helix-turn-helix transcriptional regulator [Clostridiales bacterium]|nr:helix-turn-helix transcriptional regulator [Clostridiales bacterium]
MSRSKPISLKNRGYYIAIGLNIAYYRKLCGFSQEQLAEKAGIGRDYISRIESPSFICSFSLEVLFNLAAALNIDPYQLLNFEKIPRSQIPAAKPGA